MGKINGTYKKLKLTLIWVGVLFAFTFLSILGIDRKGEQIVSAVIVEIESPEGQKSIVTEEEIQKLFEGYLGYDPRLAKINELELLDLEALLVQDGRMESVEVFLDAQNNLRVKIMEKKVVLRINGKSHSYYLDEKGRKVPSVRNRAIRVPVATGVIEEYSVELIHSDLRNNLKDVWQLAKAIHGDLFLSALVEQIHVDQKGRMIMVPKIGNEKIMLSGVDIEEKLANLKIFYKNGLPKEGWSKYASINLDIKNQIVAQRIVNH